MVPANGARAGVDPAVPAAPAVMAGASAADDPISAVPVPEARAVIVADRAARGDAGIAIGVIAAATVDPARRNRVGNPWRNCRSGCR